MQYVEQQQYGILTTPFDMLCLEGTTCIARVAPFNLFEQSMHETCCALLLHLSRAIMSPKGIMNGTFCRVEDVTERHVRKALLHSTCSRTATALIAVPSTEICQGSRSSVRATYSYTRKHIISLRLAAGLWHLT